MARWLCRLDQKVVRWINFGFLVWTASCGMRTSSNVYDLPLTKQKQKVVLLQKKIQIAKKEQQRISQHLQKLNEDMCDTQLACIRKKIDYYEDLFRKDHKKCAYFDISEAFIKELEVLQEMIQRDCATFEAHVLLERILQIIPTTENNTIYHK